MTLKFPSKSIELIDGSKIYYTNYEQVKRSLANDELFRGFCEASESADIVSGEYEGGLKVWEGALDLCNFIVRHPALVQEANLGCGGALPSILAMKLGASFVTVQDFNSLVIEHFTKPNFVLNDINCGVDFIFGDWRDCLAGIEPKRFDQIFTSETLYNSESYDNLHKAMDHALCSNGTILLATKVFYFGVGGCLPAWEEFVDRQGLFKLEEKCNSQLFNVPRKIVQLSRKKD